MVSTILSSTQPLEPTEFLVIRLSKWTGLLEQSANLQSELKVRRNPQRRTWTGAAGAGDHMNPVSVSKMKVLQECSTEHTGSNNKKPYLRFLTEKGDLFINNSWVPIEHARQKQCYSIENTVICHCFIWHLHFFFCPILQNFLGWHAKII